MASGFQKNTLSSGFQQKQLFGYHPFVEWYKLRFPDKKEKDKKTKSSRVVHKQIDQNEGFGEGCIRPLSNNVSISGKSKFLSRFK